MRELQSQLTAAEFAELLAYERLVGPVDPGWRLDHAVAQLMALWVNSRRRRGGARAKVGEFMPVWPLARPPRPSLDELAARLNAWAGATNGAVETARRRAGAAARSPSSTPAG